MRTLAFDRETSWRGPGTLRLPPAVWRTRHRWVSGVLLAHLPVLAWWAWTRETPWGVGVLLAIPAALYLVAAAEQLSGGRVLVSRLVASCAAGAGLMACSSYLVAVSGGYIEAHFHFFVMVPVVALYEDWAPFSVAVAWVVVEHGLVGTLWPHHVYGHSAAHIEHPWRFALVHGGFFAAACVGSLTAWTLSERARSVQEGLVEELSHRSTHDELTGLANRGALQSAMQEALAEGRPLAVLLLDLNGFKQVNDSLGHAAGDELLREVATRASAQICPPGVVARLGGDEFVVALPGHDLERALVQAQRLRTAIAAPLVLHGTSTSTTASIGVTASPAPPRHGWSAASGAGPASRATAQDQAAPAQASEPAGAGEVGSLEKAVEQLLRQADVAMYQAKATGAGASVYDASLDAHTAERLQAITDFRIALDSTDQIRVHLQPKVSVATGALVGVEALARWAHPMRGLISPADFMAMATSPEFNEPFTRRILHVALEQCAAWLAQGYRVPVSVNITAATLLRPDFPLEVVTALGEHALPPQMLCLEITEDAFITDPVLAAEVLHGLRRQGVRASIDDFGTGFSSLSYLRQLPIDELKIDRSFVTAMFPDGARGPVDEVLVASISELGHRLGVHVVAEGVEQQHELEALTRLGCDSVQGFLHCPPVPADQFPTQLLHSALTHHERAQALAEPEAVLAEEV